MLEIKTNAKRVREQLEKDAKEMVKGVKRTMQKWGNDTIRYGKKKKVYKRKSGNLDRAQKAKVNGLTLNITIDASEVTNKGVNYGLVQHEGSKYIQPDPWLFNAVDDGIGKLENELADVIEKALS